MPCVYRTELRALSGDVEETIQKALRKRDGEVEACLVLFCKSCDCVHVTLLRTAQENQSEADERAFNATIEGLRLIQQSLEVGENQNDNQEEKPAAFPKPSLPN